VFLIIIIEGASNIVTYYFNSFYICFLSADGRSYVNNEINVVVTLLTYIAKIIMALSGIDIILLQMSYFCIKIPLVFIYKIYFNKNYGWLDLNAAPKKVRLKDRNSYAIEAVSWLAFSSTDMIVLSSFVSTAISSVYAVYTLIFNGLNTLVNSVYFGVNYKLSKSYHEDIEKYKKLHDAYTSIFLGGMTILLCTAYPLILPFISLYVGDVKDVQYVNTSLPILFCLIQLLSWSRYVMGNLAGVAGYQKQQGNVSIVEAVTNIILSVILVHKYEIVGVLFASVVALPIKIIYLTWLCERKILKRNPVKFLRILCLNYAFFGVVVLVSKFIKLTIPNFISFVLHGIAILGICAIIGIAINCWVNPYCIVMVKKVIKRK
jgi:O-antigen/teichoic acid export membrane protein